MFGLFASAYKVDLVLVLVVLAVVVLLLFVLGGRWRR